MRGEIESLASNGCGILRDQGRAVFIPWTVPGDEVAWEIAKDRGRYCEGRAVELLKRSPERVDPPCPWFGTCGGCQLQMASPHAQASAKARWIYDAFIRIGKFSLSESPRVRASEPFAYRRRINLRVLPTPTGPALAYAQAGNPDTAVFPDACLLLSDLPLLAEIRDRFAHFEPATGSVEGRAWLYRLQRGFGCWLRVSGDVQQWMERLKPLLDSAHWQAVAVESREGVSQLGDWDLSEELEGMRFALAPTSFLQGHRQLSRELWADVVNWACAEQGSILDLYSGIGVTGLLCALRGHTVTMVEADPSLTRAAHQTAEMYGLDVQILTGRVEEILPRLPVEGIRTLLVNPPRPGLSPEAISLVQQLGPDRISYVSCHPATCARDLKALPGYRLESLQGYDLFPQTAHVECWATLRRGA